MLITKELILKNRTKNGAWTRDQLQALGVKWPPKHGWMNRVIGKPISSDNLRRLEEKSTAKEVKSINSGMLNFDITDEQQSHLNSM